MKFLVNAQLPSKLSFILRDRGHDVIHTLDLTHGNRSSDSILNEISIREQRVVITKDSDFVDSFLLKKEPWKLLLVSTSNIRNFDLITLFNANLDKICEGFDSSDFIEVTRTKIIFHS